MGTVVRVGEFTSLPVGTVLRSESELVAVKLATEHWAVLGQATPSGDADMAATKVIWNIIYLPEEDNEQS